MTPGQSLPPTLPSSHLLPSSHQHQPLPQCCAATCQISHLLLQLPPSPQILCPTLSSPSNSLTSVLMLLDARSAIFCCSSVSRACAACLSAASSSSRPFNASFSRQAWQQIGRGGATVVCVGAECGCLNTRSKAQASKRCRVRTHRGATKQRHSVCRTNAADARQLRNTQQPHLLRRTLRVPPLLTC